jgi:hypothetical protein
VDPARENDVRTVARLELHSMQQLHCRDEESQSLTTACLRCTENIFASKKMRYGLLLNRCHMGVPELSKTLHRGLRELQRREGSTTGSIDLVGRGCRQLG